MTRPDTVLVGAGRLARAFVPGLLDAGYDVVGVVARNAAGARRFRRACPGVRVSTRLATVRNAGLILLAVPDGAVADVAEAMSTMDCDWRGRIVLHHAGALGLEVLAPLVAGGAAIGVVHPLQALGAAGADVLAGSRARVDGHPAAARLARDLRMHPFRLEDGSDTALYHAAASMASNDLAALLAVAVDLMMAAGADRRDALAGVLRLAEGALANLRAGGFEGGVTGPVVRGDEATIRSHLETMRSRSVDAAEIHRLLSRRLIELAPPGAPRRAVARALSGRSDDPAV